MTPSVAILINNRNNARYLRECVESALAQTRPADEIVVYDDASSDGSREILEEFAGRVTLLWGEDQPGRSQRSRAARAQYEAFKASTSAWVLFLDGDDAFEPEKVAVVLELLAECPDASLIQNRAKHVDGEGRALPFPDDGRLSVTDHRRWIREKQDCDLFMPTSCLALPRSLLARELPFDFSIEPELAADARMAIAASFQGTVINTTQALTRWRHRTGSLGAVSAARRFYLVTMTLARSRLFNRHARRHGERTISPWRCSRFYRQCAAAMMPSAASGWVRLRFRSRLGTN